MADETITGCVNFTTGQIEFFQSPGCNYNGCMIWDGVHAGQVSIVDPGICEDTYYGCVDFSTGEFAISIPDNCCLLGGLGGNCEYCDSGTTPEYIRLTFTSVLDCDCHQRSGSPDIWAKSNGDMASSINRSGGPAWTLKQENLGDNCNYRNVFSGDFGSWLRYNNDVCTAFLTEYDIDTFTIQYNRDERFPITRTLFIQVGGTGPDEGSNYFLHFGVTAFSDCMIPSSPVNNDFYTDCQDLTFMNCYSGTCTVQHGLSLWVIDINYIIGDYVFHDGTVYKCNTAHTSSEVNEPPNLSFWD